MKKYTKAHPGILTAAAAGLLLVAQAHAGSDGSDLTAAASSQAQDTTWQVEMRGKPPYKRQRVPVVSAPEVDIAAMEVMESTETEIVWKRGNRPYPPFQRERVEVPVVDGAAMELSTESSKTKFRGRPPFKRNS